MAEYKFGQHVTLPDGRKGVVTDATLVRFVGVRTEDYSEEEEYPLIAALTPGWPGETVVERGLGECPFWRLYNDYGHCCALDDECVGEEHPDCPLNNGVVIVRRKEVE